MDIDEVSFLQDCPEVNPLSQRNDLYKLWRAINDGKVSGQDLIEIQSVPRDPESLRVSEDVQVPELCRVFTGLLSVQWSQFEIKGILIREEYMKVLSDVISYATNAQANLTSTSDKDIDDDETECYTSTCDTQLKPFENPFDDPSSHECDLASRGAIIIGHPGIGKTVWLLFVLVLRLLARLPTVYMTKPERMLVFTNEGAFEVDPAKITEHVFAKHLPQSTWCLVDSNQKLVDMPDAIRLLGRFIVQSSSPRSERSQWIKKTPRHVLQYITKPWTLSELIVARSFQGTPVTEKQLETFYSLYSPSARVAYANAAYIPVYEEILNKELSSLTPETLQTIVTESSGLNMYTAISHQIVTVLPGATRLVADVVIPTRHLYHLLRDRHSRRSLEEVANLYNLFSRHKYTRSSAGYMLEDAMHALFSAGGHWELRDMVKSERRGKVNQHWKSPPHLTPCKYICLGLPGHILTITSQPPTTGYNSLNERRFLLDDRDLALEDGYYVPDSGSQPTFDAFIYDKKSATATIFQSIISKKHSVKPQGIEWLLKLGVEDIHYIAVTPEIDIDLPFRHDLDKVVGKRYQLVVDSLDALIPVKVKKLKTDCFFGNNNCYSTLCKRS